MVLISLAYCQQQQKMEPRLEMDQASATLRDADDSSHQ